MSANIPTLPWVLQLQCLSGKFRWSNQDQRFVSTVFYRDAEDWLQVTLPKMCKLGSGRGGSYIGIVRLTLLSILKRVRSFPYISYSVQYFSSLESHCMGIGSHHVMVPQQNPRLINAKSYWYC